MAYKFVTYAIDGLLNGEDDTVVCHTKNDFVYKSIDEVANTPHHLDKELIEFLENVQCTN